MTIDDSERKQVELDKLKKETSNLKFANESLQKQKIQIDNLEKKVEKFSGIVENNNFSKIVFENIDSHKKLLLESMGKEQMKKYAR